jgi:cytochrome P450
LKVLFDRLQKRPVAYARIRSALSRHPLPPGDLASLDLLEKSDRDALRRRADEWGPVFKGIAWGRLCVCIVGLARCRRFTQVHGADLRVVTMELAHLIPKGFVKAMEGDDHRQIRRATQAALRSAESASYVSAQNESVLESIAATALRDYADRAAGPADAPDAYSAAMSAIATSMLTWLFFGAGPGTAEHQRFLAHFSELGPYGLVWNPQKRQEDAFRAFRDDLRAEATALQSGAGRLSPAGLLARMAQEGTLDETMLGNLIYQAEMARSDLKNLFRWLTRHAADDPAVLDRIAAEGAAENTGTADGGERPLAEAFVLETLRTDQSERLMRRAERDIVFDGFLIPRHATVRLCLWESHHLEDAFEDPHRFDPGRFLAEMPGADRYAPFGLDHHQCPMGGVAIRIGMAFLRALARGYRVTALTEGPAVRGAYHWEAAPTFAVRLTQR